MNVLKIVFIDDVLGLGDGLEESSKMVGLTAGALLIPALPHGSTLAR